MEDKTNIISAEKMNFFDDPEIDSLLQEAIKASDEEDYESFWKLQDKVADIRLKKEDERLAKEEAAKPKNWEYFSKPHLNDFGFYEEKAKFIFKNQLAHREFLLEYRDNKKWGHVKKIEKMSMDEFRTILGDIRFLDEVQEKIPQYPYMYVLYSCGIPYTEMEHNYFPKGKGSIEAEVKKGVAACAELLMEKDIKNIRGKELVQKILTLRKLEFENNPDRYYEFIGDLAMKMKELYLELAKKK